MAVGYALPAPDLRAYLSTYSLTVVDPGSPKVRDQVYPEWPNVRFSADGHMAACTGPGPLVDCNPICAIGPTSHATHFTLEPGSYWTVSMLPAGWARLLDVPAGMFADHWEIVTAGGTFEGFAPLLTYALEGPAPPTVVANIDRHMRTLLAATSGNDGPIQRAHAALIDPAVTTVAELAERSGMGVRTFERLSRTVFGFTPKLLLRRQRFLRSLAQYMLDPSLAWIDTLDSQYVDQAHFIRDFRRFMDTTPRAYAAQPHPVLWAAAHARAAVSGKAMQVLQAPDADRTLAVEPLEALR